MNITEYLNQLVRYKRYTFAYWFGAKAPRHYMTVLATSKEEAIEHFLHTPEYYSCYSCFTFPLKEEEVEFYDEHGTKIY